MNEEEKELVEGIKQYPTHRELCLIHVIERLDEELNKKDKIINTAFRYVKKKQSQQYKYALSKIECDELIKILKVEEENE